MSRFTYDLHIHSCLSPCGDNESTPDSIAGMGELNGLQLMALTDHNTAKNCPAFFKAAARHGVIPVAGMELTTAEEIHVVCLFGTLEQAMAFDTFVEQRLLPVKNRPEIFGEQRLVDEFDQQTGTFDTLLISATSLSYEEVPRAVASFGGVCFPAHIDRTSNGVIAVLGALPDQPEYRVVEVHDGDRVDEWAARVAIAPNNILVNSDAHTLWDIKEAKQTLELSASPDDAAGVRNALLTAIKEGL